MVQPWCATIGDVHVKFELIVIVMAYYNDYCLCSLLNMFLFLFSIVIEYLVNEHIVENFENVALVEIAPHGSCYLEVFATFMKLSKLTKLKTIGKKGWINLAMLCLKVMQNETFVMEFLYTHRDVLTFTDLEYDVGQETVTTVERSIDQIQEIIVAKAKELFREFGDQPKKERDKKISTKLSSMWDSMFVEYFFPAMSSTFNVEIVIWTLKTDEEDDRLEIKFTFDPNKEKPDAQSLDTCNVLWCETERRAAHYQLLNIDYSNQKKVLIDLR